MSFIQINIIDPMVEQITENVTNVIEEAIDNLVTGAVNLIVGGITSLFGKRDDTYQVILAIMQLLHFTKDSQKSFIMINIIDPMIDAIVDNVTTVVEEAIDNLVTGAVNLIVGGITSLFGKRDLAALQALHAVMQIINAIPTQIAQLLLPHTSEIVHFFIQHWDMIVKILPILEKHGAQIVHFLETYTVEIIHLFEQVIPVLVHYSSQIMHLIGIFTNQLLPFIEQLMTGFWPHVRVGYVTALNEFKDSLAKLNIQVLAQIVAIAETLFSGPSLNQIVAIAEQVLNYLAPTIANGIETVVNILLQAIALYADHQYVQLIFQIVPQIFHLLG